MKNITCYGCYEGIEIIGGQRVTVSDCNMSYSGNRGFGIGWGDWPNSEEIPENHLIINNTIRNSKFKGMIIGGYGGTTLFNNTIYDNGWGYNGQNQIHVFADEDITVANNTLWGVWGGSANIFCYSYNSVIANNTCLDSNGHGIELEDRGGNEVINNYCYRTSLGIEIHNSDNNYVANNTCLENGVGITIGTTGSNNIVEFNNCSDGGFAGIYFTGFDVTGSDNLIRKNVCMNNTGSGIYLWDVNSINMIANNTCTENTNEGILPIRSEWVHITNNTCTNNPIGISIDFQSHNNSVYWNGLLANTENAIDNGLNNTITNNYHGIYLTDSCDNIISNKTFFNSGLFIS